MIFENGDFFSGLQILRGFLVFDLFCLLWFVGTDCKSALSVLDIITAFPSHLGTVFQLSKTNQYCNIQFIFQLLLDFL
jgi:hypothetical protein